MIGTQLKKYFPTLSRIAKVPTKKVSMMYLHWGFLDDLG